MFKKKQKPIYLYAVTKKEDFLAPIFFAPTEAGAQEALANIIVNQNKDHYKSWCELREHDPENSENVQIYFKQVLAEEVSKDYTIVKLTYAVNDIAAIFNTLLYTPQQ